MFSLSLYGALFLVLAVIGLLALALACAVSRPGSPVNTVRLTAPIFLEDNSPLYDVESMPRGRWGGATGGQWVFQFDGRRYKQERFDAFILRRSEESGVHEPVSHFEVSNGIVISQMAASPRGSRGR
jgi:hypothetical protein